MLRSPWKLLLLLLLLFLPPSQPLREVSSCQHEVSLCPYSLLTSSWSQALAGSLEISSVTNLHVLHVLSLVQKWWLILQVSASSRVLHLAVKVLPQLPSPCLINGHPVSYSFLIFLSVFTSGHLSKRSLLSLYLENLASFQVWFPPRLNFISLGLKTPCLTFEYIYCGYFFFSHYHHHFLF